MANNMYSFVNFQPKYKSLARLRIQIVKWGLQRRVNCWNLLRRLSSFWLIYWNDTPGATLKFRDRTIKIMPGKLILIPPYTLVSAETNEPFIHNYVEFEADQPFKFVKCCPLEFPAAEFVPVLKNGADKIHISLALYSLTERLLMQVPPDYFNSFEKGLFDPRIESVLKYMDSRIMKEYSIEELARHVNLSESRLLHLFKKETGITPREYWMKQKLGIVLHLLQETDLSISEIADEFGFVDRSHLSRVLKSEFKMTPAAIRKSFAAVDPKRVTP